jgi:putative effector of murein hydrolase
MRSVRGRLAAVSVRGSMAAGWWVGVALGLVIGSLVGAVLVWFTAAVLNWQQELAFTLGIARTLLPFGDQVGALHWVSSNWWIVIPMTALLWAVFSGLVGAVIGGLLAAAYNRSPRHASVVVELPEVVDVD